MKKKVLIIEDDNILQEAISDALKSEGFEVIQAIDGEAGFSMTKTQKPDLVILDLLLPKKDGWEVLKDIKADKSVSSIPVVVVTAFESESSNRECIEAGAKYYLVKTSYTLAEIVEKVKSTLSGD